MNWKMFKMPDILEHAKTEVYELKAKRKEWNVQIAVRDAEPKNYTENDERSELLRNILEKTKRKRHTSSTKRR
jgi:hypothetical protein